MKDGKIAIVEEEAELVRSIFLRYLELGSVNELLRDLRERNIRTKTRLLATGATRGGIPFGRGALYYLLSNHFYIGEVKYKNEILPGEQPPIMDRALFEAVRQKSLAQWPHRTIVRNKSDHLLTGLLFDDAGHRMVPTHATKAGVRYRYYVSTPFRFPSTGSRQGWGRRSVAARHRSRTVARCASRMEPAVRGPWIESPIITDRVRNVAFGSHPNPPLRPL
jgi:site-specific DNA recombinase